MEEEVSYSSLVFKNNAATQKEEIENQTIYSEVKSNKPATAEQKANEDLVIDSVKPETAEVVVLKNELTAHSAEISDKSADSDQKRAELISSSEVKLEASGNSAPKAETAANGQTSLLSVCLGTLCVLLVIAVIVLSVIVSMVMKDQEATVSDLKAKNVQLSVVNSNLTNQTKQLAVDKMNLTNQTNQLAVDKMNLMNQTQQLKDDNLKLQSVTQELQNNNTALSSNILTLKNQNDQLQNNMSVLQNQTEKLTKERNNLNLTLGFILTFDTFPVKDVCPNKKCQPCLTGWIQFQDKCYFFYNDSSVWKTWDQSRQYCQSNLADLVVINNLQEQQFVGNLTKYYQDVWHGFWLGLRNVNNNWVWVDGRIDTLGFWGSIHVANESVLLVPETPPTQSWRRLTSASLDKFICERDALMWST